MSEDSFQEAVDFLYSFADFSVERSYRYSAEVFELQRVKDLLHSIGDPQEKFKAFHIAGTKGKGSVSAMTASILHEAGYRTGLYTSPHLVRLNERFQIDGQAISDDEFVAVIEHLKPHLDSFPGLTVFEILTSMAFLFFAQQGADCAVIEVGLGGPSPRGQLVRHRTREGWNYQARHPDRVVASADRSRSCRRKYRRGEIFPTHSGGKGLVVFFRKQRS
jgi:dihydrofolate synthase/folylpolyglutamate synthase